MPVREELPDTIKRSPKQAQRTWIKAHDAAVKTYGEGRRAHQTAFAALKHSFERSVTTGNPRRKPSDQHSRRRTAAVATATEWTPTPAKRTCWRSPNG